MRARLTSIAPTAVAAAWLANVLLAGLLCGCVTLTAEPRAVVSAPDGKQIVSSLSCADALRIVGSTVDDKAAALDPEAIRVVAWNLHKESDAGWQHDLSSLAVTSDLLLLQEIALLPPLRNVLDHTGLRWTLASSFLLYSDDIGVLTAARVAPLASCTQRTLEPILRIPKSAIVTWMRIAGSRATLAVVNLHAINFEFSLDAYRTQFSALTDVLAAHDGPIIFAGDFNTWSDERDRVVAATVSRLGLMEVGLLVDRRTLFMGRHLDHIFVRGLEVVDARAIVVNSSDHNPLEATFRLQ